MRGKIGSSSDGLDCARSLMARKSESAATNPLRCVSLGSLERADLRDCLPHRMGDENDSDFSVFWWPGFLYAGLSYIHDPLLEPTLC